MIGRGLCDQPLRILLPVLVNLGLGGLGVPVSSAVALLPVAWVVGRSGSVAGSLSMVSRGENLLCVGMGMCLACGADAGGGKS